MSEIQAAPPAERSLIQQIFVSPDEPRLRAGWRLLIHFILMLILTIPVLVVMGVIALLSGQLQGEAFLQENVPEWFGTITELGILITITAATWIARRFLDRRSFASMGLHLDRHTLLDLLFGIGLGGLLMALIYAFESGMGWLTFENWAWEVEPVSLVTGALLVALVKYLIVGWQEELMSRGYHLQNLWAGLNLPLALLISSGIFAVLHLGNPGASWISTLGIFWAGLFLAYGYLRTNELWIPIGVHIGWNFFQGTIFGFPVSGTKGFHLIRQTVEGPIAVTGGVFGPEAGLVSWVAMLLGAALIWLYTRNRTRAALPPPEITAPPEPVTG
jgi:uncharacterized protein